ncbi:MAG: hypothetical protein ACI4CY_00180, partial [Candidatus Gastranaerophilaceae bacterium]
GQRVVNLNKGTRLPRISPTMTSPDTVEPSKTFTEFTNKIKNGDFLEFNYWYKQCGGAFYDRGKSTGKVGSTAEEFFEKLLSSRGAIKNNICVNSADFGARVFKVAGYDAGVVMGGNSKGKPHSYLIADLKNGQYMINDYGKAYIIDAKNADAALNKFFEQTGYAASGTIAGATFNNGGSVNSTGLPYASTAPTGSDVSGFGLGASVMFGNVSSIPDAQKARSDAKDAVEELFSKKSKLADTKFTRGGEEV